MGKAAVNRNEGEVVKIIPAKKGRWEIYKHVQNKKTGEKCYGTRLIARNGNLICGNTGFNQMAGAIKNIKAIKASA
jgi:uncharacterized protein YegP (UPF0339 family)